MNTHTQTHPKSHKHRLAGTGIGKAGKESALLWIWIKLFQKLAHRITETKMKHPTHISNVVWLCIVPKLDLVHRSPNEDARYDFIEHAQKSNQYAVEHTSSIQWATKAHFKCGQWPVFSARLCSIIMDGIFVEKSSPFVCRDVSEKKWFG